MLAMMAICSKGNCASRVLTQLDKSEIHKGVCKNSIPVVGSCLSLTQPVNLWTGDNNML